MNVKLFVPQIQKRSHVETQDDSDNDSISDSIDQHIESVIPQLPYDFQERNIIDTKAVLTNDKVTIPMSEFPDEEYILLPEYVLRSEKFLRWVKQQQVREKEQTHFVIEPYQDTSKQPGGTQSDDEKMEENASDQSDESDQFINEFKDFHMVDNSSQTSDQIVKESAESAEISEKFNQLSCPFKDCDAVYVREYMINKHIDNRHNGGSKTDRENIARMLVESYAARKLKKHVLNSVRIQLYPGLLTEVAKNLDLQDEIDEEDILQALSSKQIPKEYNNSGTFQSMSKFVKEMVDLRINMNDKGQGQQVAKKKPEFDGSRGRFEVNEVNDLINHIRDMYGKKGQKVLKSLAELDKQVIQKLNMVH